MIEETMTRIATALERIATALEQSAAPAMPASNAAPVAQAAPAPTAAPVAAEPPAPTTVEPEPAPTISQQAQPPAQPVAAAQKAPFTDEDGMKQYVMTAYQELGPQKGANIQGVLSEIGYTNINEVKPEHYDALYTGIEGLKQ